jgi:hypothetical protein
VFALDETEVFRFVISTLQWTMLCCIRWGVRWIGRPGRAADVIDFTADDMFVLLSAYFHWPYVYVTDEVYEDTKLQEAREVVAVDRLVDLEAPRQTDVGDTAQEQDQVKM